MKRAFVFLLLVISLPAIAQPKDPDALLNALKRKYRAVKDYTVDATIVVDVWFLNMPVKKAKLYYKYPGKVHVETKGFALLPKKTAGFDPGAIIGDRYTAVYSKSEKWGNSIIDVVKTIPNNTDDDIILSTFWIDPKLLQIRKLEINTKSGGALQVALEYNHQPCDLPQKLVVTFDVKDMNMPKDFTGEIQAKDKVKGKKENKQGKVTITYSNYLVNKGLPDKLFEEKK